MCIILHRLHSSQHQFRVSLVFRIIFRTRKYIHFNDITKKFSLRSAHFFLSFIYNVNIALSIRCRAAQNDVSANIECDEHWARSIPKTRTVFVLRSSTLKFDFTKYQCSVTFSSSSSSSFSFLCRSLFGFIKFLNFAFGFFGANDENL